MATIEERLTFVEHEYAELKHDNIELKRDNASLKRVNEELKQTIELHTIALGGLVNKTMLESISEKNDNIFQALIKHDEFANFQLGDLREKVEVQLDGKIAGLQTAVRQGFEQQRATIVELEGKVVGLQVETRQDIKDTRAQVTELDGKVVGLQTEMRQDIKDTRAQVTELDGKVVGLQTEMRQRFDLQDTRSEVQEQNMKSGFATQDQKIEQILRLLNTLTNKPEQDT